MKTAKSRDRIARQDNSKESQDITWYDRLNVKLADKTARFFLWLLAFCCSNGCNHGFARKGLRFRSRIPSRQMKRHEAPLSFAAGHPIAFCTVAFPDLVGTQLKAA